MRPSSSLFALLLLPLQADCRFGRGQCGAEAAATCAPQGAARGGASAVSRQTTKSLFSHSMVAAGFAVAVVRDSGRWSLLPQPLLLSLTRSRCSLLSSSRAHFTPGTSASWLRWGSPSSTTSRERRGLLVLPGLLSLALSLVSLSSHRSRFLHSCCPSVHPSLSVRIAIIHFNFASITFESSSDGWAGQAARARRMRQLEMCVSAAPSHEIRHLCRCSVRAWC